MPCKFNKLWLFGKLIRILSLFSYKIFCVWFSFKDWIIFFFPLHSSFDGCFRWHRPVLVLNLESTRVGHIFCEISRFFRMRFLFYDVLACTEVQLHWPWGVGGRKCGRPARMRGIDPSLRTFLVMCICSYIDIYACSIMSLTLMSQ